jgi:hypothetical protein
MDDEQAPVSLRPVEGACSVCGASLKWLETVIHWRRGYATSPARGDICDPGRRGDRTAT